MDTSPERSVKRKTLAGTLPRNLTTARSPVLGKVIFRTARTMSLIVVTLLVYALGAQAQTETVTFVSDPTWAVSDTGGTFIGFAQNICQTLSPPQDCMWGVGAANLV